MTRGESGREAVEAHPDAPCVGESREPCCQICFHEVDLISVPIQGREGHFVAAQCSNAACVTRGVFSAEPY